MPVGATEVSSALRTRIRRWPRARPRPGPGPSGSRHSARRRRGEGALLLGEPGGGEVGRPLQAAHPLGDEAVRRRPAVARPAHDERVGEPCDAEPDAPLSLRLLALRRDGEARAVDRVVQHPDGGGGERLQRRHVELGILLEGVPHQAREVDRAEQARAVGRQRLLAAGVGGEDLFAVGEVVGPVDAVDEDHAGLGVGVGRADDALPQRAAWTVR